MVAQRCELVDRGDRRLAVKPLEVPTPDGHLFHLSGAPNHYGIRAFYELHVETWRDNPDGTVFDWNARVTCDDQPLP